MLRPLPTSRFFRFFSNHSSTHSFCRLHKGHMVITPRCLCAWSTSHPEKISPVRSPQPCISVCSFARCMRPTAQMTVAQRGLVPSMAVVVSRLFLVGFSFVVLRIFFRFLLFNGNSTRCLDALEIRTGHTPQSQPHARFSLRDFSKDLDGKRRGKGGMSSC